MDILLLGLIWYAVFLLSSTLHEAAHAFVALKLGDETAYQAGQATLDPLPHIRREPVGMIVVPILFFIFSRFTFMLGWASAPYDPEWARRHPRRAAYMALAGPLSNLLLTFVAVGLIHLGIYMEIFFEPNRIVFSSVVGAYQEGLPTVAATFVSILFSLNLVLFVFNLFPLPPLDGSALFPLVMGEERAVLVMEALNQPGIALIGLLIAWLLFDQIFHPIHLFAINLLYPGLTYQ